MRGNNNNNNNTFIIFLVRRQSRALDGGDGDDHFRWCDETFECGTDDKDDEGYAEVATLPYRRPRRARGAAAQRLYRLRLPDAQKAGPPCGTVIWQHRSAVLSCCTTLGRLLLRAVAQYLGHVQGPVRSSARGVDAHVTETEPRCMAVPGLGGQA